MPGIYDLIEQMMGRPDPVAQLAAGRGPQPLPQPAVGGGAPPPPTGAPPASPEPDGAPPGGAPAQAQQQQQPPTPQAYQSPQDMQQMYAQLMQRQQGSDMFNRGMANFVAGFSPLSQRASIASNFDQGPDAGNIMGNIMRLQQWNQQQQQYQAFQQSAPDTAKLLGPNVTPQMVLAMGEEATKLAVQYNAPTEAVRSYAAARAALKAAGLSDADINQRLPPEMILLGPNADISQQQYTQYAAAARARGEVPPDYDTWKANIAIQTKTKSDVALNQTNATQGLPGLNTQLGGVEENITSIVNNPRLPNVLGKWTPTTGLAANLFHDPEDIKLAQQIQDLHDQMVSGSFAGRTASSKTAQDLAQLGQRGASALAATSLNPHAFTEGLYDVLDQARATHANAYGETGDVTSMPGQYNGYLDSSYRQGGPIKVKGAPGALMPIDPDMLKQVRGDIAKHGRQYVISNLRQQGYDTSGI